LNLSEDAFDCVSRQRKRRQTHCGCAATLSFASPEDTVEAFGAAAPGMSRDENYDAVCRLADQVPDPDLEAGW